jgi:hypothetical protein
MNGERTWTRGDGHAQEEVAREAVVRRRDSSGKHPLGPVLLSFRPGLPECVARPPADAKAKKPSTTAASNI